MILMLTFFCNFSVEFMKMFVIAEGEKFSKKLIQL